VNDGIVPSSKNGPESLFSSSFHLQTTAVVKFLEQYKRFYGSEVALGDWWMGLLINTNFGAQSNASYCVHVYKAPQR
jgi:hypothetical protein